MTQSKIEVTCIEIKIGKKVLRLSIDEAKDLHRALDEALFEKPSPWYPIWQTQTMTPEIRISEQLEQVVPRVQEVVCSEQTSNGYDLKYTPHNPPSRLPYYDEDHLLLK